MVSVPIWIIYVFWYAFGVGSGVAAILGLILWAKRKIDAAASAAWAAGAGSPLDNRKAGARNE